MVKTKDEILASIKAKFGEDTSDETIALLEDISDTLDTTKDSVDWKTKYEENDKAWREKYTSRFYDTPANENPAPEDSDNEDTSENVTINDLFAEKK